MEQNSLKRFPNTLSSVAAIVQREVKMFSIHWSEPQVKKLLHAVPSNALYNGIA
jgi:hypothetical protein